MGGMKTGGWIGLATVLSLTVACSGGDSHANANGSGGSGGSDTGGSGAGGSGGSGISGGANPSGGTGGALPQPEPGDTDFVSDSPAQNGSAGSFGAPGAGAGGTASAGGTTGSGGAPASDGKGEAERAIAEADIVQVDGTRLYALSRYGGLSVIDVGTRDRLTLLGRFKMQATPFEMYVRGKVVVAMFTDWGDYVKADDGSYQWKQTSRVVGLDTTDPGNITIRGHFEIPGSISDSRIVGDVLYAVAHEDGYCYQCQANKPRTNVLSLAVSDPAHMAKVDQLSFDDVNDQYGWGSRSISVTADRMYVGGRDYSNNGQSGSTIQVVDISDPGGDMVLGTTVHVDGEITNRWQMDETSGVLRVISQPPQWNLANPPVIQTFKVTSSSNVTPLGRAGMILPKPEMLNTVRFDGDRAYAITSERKDPLFTIDLSNPAFPRQVGALEMPGWIYYLEPRGDRVLGLGYDQQNPEGAVTVSLFDVSNLAAPKMLDRVNFGGTWASLAEDQDRIHKSFQVLDGDGLILVPYSGSSTTSDGTSCYSYNYASGVQLVDFAGDSLTLRGVAPAYGEARRAFLHDQRLFTVSDDRVESFDVANRDAPKSTARLALAQHVTQTAVIGDGADKSVVRFGRDWWSNKVSVDVTSLDTASTPVTQTFDFDPGSEGSGQGCKYSYPDSLLPGPAKTAVLLSSEYDYSSTNSKEGISLAILDFSKPDSPSLASRVSLPGGMYDYDSYNGMVQFGASYVQAGRTIVRKRVAGAWSNATTPPYYGSWVVSDVGIDVVDLSDPSKPETHSLSYALTNRVTGLLASGNEVLMGRYEPTKEDANRVRFYIDRIDVSDPTAPHVAASVNVPGSLFAWDASTNRAVTVDYRRKVQTGVTSQTCMGIGYSNWFTPDQVNEWGGYDPNALGSCTSIVRTLHVVHLDGTHAVLEASRDVEQDRSPVLSATSDGRAFVSLGTNYYGGYGYWLDCWGPCGGASVTTKSPLLVFSDLASGAPKIAQFEVEHEGYGGYVSLLVASGSRALIGTGWRGSLSILETNTGTPEIARNVDIVGYPSQITQAGSKAIISMDLDGVTVVDIAK